MFWEIILIWNICPEVVVFFTQKHRQEAGRSAANRWEAT